MYKMNVRATDLEEPDTKKMEEIAQTQTIIQENITVEPFCFKEDYRLSFPASWFCSSFGQKLKFRKSKQWRDKNR